jgi:hypothetical protein
MRKLLHRFFIRLSIQFEDPNGNQFDDGFDGIPSSDETSTMTTRSLARLLSNTQSGSPAHVILSHELNLKIARDQSKATLRAGWIGFSGAIIAAAFTAWLGYNVGSSATKDITRCSDQQISTTTKGAPESKIK